jgi:hypothetical protein
MESELGGLISGQPKMKRVHGALVGGGGGDDDDDDDDDDDFEPGRVMWSQSWGGWSADSPRWDACTGRWWVVMMMMMMMMMILSPVGL